MVLAKLFFQKGRRWPCSLLFMTSLLIPGTPHYMPDQHIIAMFSGWIVYKCLYNQQKPSGWCMTTLIWMWPANYMLSDMVLCVLIPDRARCPASARAHLLLLSNRSLGKCPLACQSVNILFVFFLPLLQAMRALLLCHLLCMRFIISWGKRVVVWCVVCFFFFMAASDNPPNLQSVCMASGATCYRAACRPCERDLSYFIQAQARRGRWFICRREGRSKSTPHPHPRRLPSLSLPYL